MSFPFVLEFDSSSILNVILNLILTTSVFAAIVYSGFGLGYIVAKKRLTNQLLVKCDTCKYDGDHATQEKGLTEDGIYAERDVNENNPKD